MARRANRVHGRVYGLDEMRERRSGWRGNHIPFTAGWFDGKVPVVPLAMTKARRGKHTGKYLSVQFGGEQDQAGIPYQ